MEKAKISGRRYPAKWRWLCGMIAISGLLSVFIFQRMEWLNELTAGNVSPKYSFLLNRCVRFLLNDIFAVLLVLAIFANRSRVIIALWIQLFGFIFIMIPYVILKINFPAYNGPLISFLHRLVLNPVLIYLIIFYFGYYELEQRKLVRREKS